MKYKPCCPPPTSFSLNEICARALSLILVMANVQHWFCNGTEPLKCFNTCFQPKKPQPTKPPTQQNNQPPPTTTQCLSYMPTHIGHTQQEMQFLNHTGPAWCCHVGELLSPKAAQDSPLCV